MKKSREAKRTSVISEWVLTAPKKPVSEKQKSEFFDEAFRLLMKKTGEV